MQLYKIVATAQRKVVQLLHALAEAVLVLGPCVLVAV